MGMSASQARFLELTARKSNVEYQGQQINQQRTALANESANIYTQLNKMEVPTPPVVSDFYKTVYSFTSNSLSSNNDSVQYKFDEVKDTPDGKKAVLRWTSTKQGFKTSNIIGSSGSSLVQGTSYKEEDKDELVTTYGSTHAPRLTGLKFFDSSAKERQIFKSTYSNYKSSIAAITDVNSGNYSQNFVSAYQNATDDTPVYYYLNDNGDVCFCDPSDISGAFNDDGSVKSDLSGLYVHDGYVIRAYEYTEKDEFNIDSYDTNDTGRITSVKVGTKQYDSEGNEIFVNFEVDCTREQDEEAFDQAKMDYDYNYAKYNKEVSDLNNKIKGIQEKPETLLHALKDAQAAANYMDWKAGLITTKDYIDVSRSVIEIKPKVQSRER